MLRSIVKSICISAVLVGIAFMASASELTMRQCEGSRMPYPEPKHTYALPDSLKAVAIAHIGRHGARFPSSSEKIEALYERLSKAYEDGQLSPEGINLLHLTERTLEMVDGRWGALDSLGMAEQRGIARRTYNLFPEAFSDGVSAVASLVPRCRMSMYCFLEGVADCNDAVEISTASGPEYTPLLRPFSVNPQYLAYREEKQWQGAYESFCQKHLPALPAYRLFNAGTAISSKEAHEICDWMYYLISSLNASGIKCDASRFFTQEEYNALWRCDNMRQYFTRSANHYSLTPELIAEPLLLNIIEALQESASGDAQCNVTLRFGHAETLYPLLSLLGIKGCKYIGDDVDNLERYWRTYEVAPMAVNLMFILCSNSSGKLYLRVDLNEQPIALNEEYPDSIIVDWDDARAYLLQCAGKVN